MRQFLRETLELGYWAFFCPSRLQARMNAWSIVPSKDNDLSRPVSGETLLAHANTRFVIEYLTLAGLCSLPLILQITYAGAWQDGWLVPIALVSAYGLGVWMVTLGLVLPLLFTIPYAVVPSLFSTLLSMIAVWMPQQLFWGLTLGITSLTIVAITGSYLFQQQKKIAAKSLVTFGTGISVALGSWLTGQKWSFVLVASGLVIIGFFLLCNEDNDDFEGVIGEEFSIAIIELVLIMFIVAYSVLVITILAIVANNSIIVITVFALTVIVIFDRARVLAFVVAPSVAFIIAGLVLAPTIQFCIVGWLVGICSTPGRWRSGSLLFATATAVLSVDQQGWWAALIIPSTALGYYRLLPFYPLEIVLALIVSHPSFSRILISPIERLYWLPPYTDELLWLPLPSHARLLIATFRQNAARALETLQRLQSLPMPGFRWTARRALPQIVADQLAAVRTLADVMQTSTLGHPYLPLLVPEFYQSASSQETPTRLRRKQPEIDTLFPALQDAARDVAAALQSTSASLRERELERVSNNLWRLQGQLPSLGLRAQVVERWRPVYEQWQKVIQAGIDQQRILASRELLNPFQFGNPLRPDRAALFRGRGHFADQIVRLVLDRSRPTLVLYGPRRCGKSSFLLNLSRLLPSEILPVYVDLQSAAATTSEADFCFSLVRALERDCRSQGIKLPLPKREDFLPNNPYSALEDWLDSALPRLGGRRILVNLDEFEKLGEALSAGRLSTQLLDQLRHLIQHYDALGFLFSGVQTLAELGPHWSSYFISVVPMELLYLAEAEARDLLLHPDPDFALRYADGVVDEIVALTRGQPYLLQLIGANLVKQANLAQTQQADAALLEAALQSAFIDGQIYFTNLWEEFTGTTPAEVAAGQTLLTALAQGTSPAVEGDPVAQAALQRLLRYHVLERTATGYRFEIPLVERWVQEEINNSGWK